MNPHELRVETAKAGLFMRFPFFGYIVARLNISENSNIDTLCIDEKCNVSYNKNFIEKMSDANLLAVLSHEALHAVFLHTIFFRDTVDRAIMNFAADLEVNDIIVNLENMDLPMNTELNLDTGKGNNSSSISGFAPDRHSGEFVFIKNKKWYKIKCRGKSSIEIYDKIYPLLKDENISYGGGFGLGEDGQTDSQDGSGSGCETGNGKNKKQIAGGFDNHDFKEIQSGATLLEEQSCRGKSSIEIYDKIYPLLKEENLSYGGGSGLGADGQQKQSGGGNGTEKGKGKKQIAGGFDNHDFKEIQAEAEKLEEQSKWNETLIGADIFQQSVQPNKDYGGGGCWYGRYIDSILKPQIDWRAVLRKHLIELIPFDYSYSTPAKKSYAIKVYEPKILRKPLGVTVCIDVSGSIGEEELREFLSEVVGVAKAASEISIRRLYWSTEVDEKNDEVFTRKNLRQLFTPAKNIHSTGGNYISCVQEYIEKHRNRNTESLFIYITDGYEGHGKHKFPKKSLIVLSPDGTEEYLKGFAPIIKMQRKK